MQGPVCPLNWRTVFICFYIVLNFCFVHFNKTVTNYGEYLSEATTGLFSATSVARYDYWNGATETREWTTWHGRKCRGGKRGSK